MTAIITSNLNSQNWQPIVQQQTAQLAQKRQDSAPANVPATHAQAPKPVDPPKVVRNTDSQTMPAQAPVTYERVQVSSANRPTEYEKPTGSVPSANSVELKTAQAAYQETAAGSPAQRSDFIRV